MNIRFLFILTSIPFILHAQQKFDYNWVIGVNGGGGNLLSFTEDTLQITHLPQFDMTLEAANTSMSDENGNLAFYSNGCFVANRHYEQMDNGDNLNPGEMQQVWCPTGGNPVSQAILSLPDPGNADRYYIFHEGMNSWFPPSGSDFAPFDLYYSIVDMTKNGGLGKVTEKNIAVLTDTLFRGFITACRHANGRDWWVLAPKHNSNCFFKLLLSPDGVDSIGMQCIGDAWNGHDLGGQAIFSPNGEKYVLYQPCHGLDVFDFDRCTGELSNDMHVSMLPDSCNVGGVAISSNSRFVYVTTLLNLYQLDLWEEDIANSKKLIAEWDGYSNPNPTTFWLAQLAPNDKIYIAPRYLVYNLHVINHPDSLGIACDLVQHGIELPGPVFSSLPSFPYFGLGAMEGPCDTIVATTAPLLAKETFIIFPNPASGLVTVEFPKSYGSLYLRFFDLLGKQRSTFLVHNSKNEIDISELEKGVYIFQLYSNKSILTQGKIIIK